MAVTDQQIPSTMKGLQILGFAKNEEEEKTPYTMKHDIPVPKVGENDLLIELRSSGFCHTEMVARGEFKSMMHQDLPIIPSHEPTGVIVALGDKAAKTNAPGEDKPFKIGDRVGAIAFDHCCGECSDCKIGKNIYCEKHGMTGVTSDGAFAEYQSKDQAFTFRLPDKLSFDAAAPLCCAGLTIYSAIKQCNLEKGQRLAIVGAGALGHLGIQFARCLGLEVSVVDSRDPPLKMCQSLPYPPHHILNSSSTDLKDPKSVSKAVETLGGLADAVIIATDVIPAFDLGLEIVKKHGLFMVVGQPRDPIPIPFHQLIFRNITVKGSLLGDAATAKEMCDLVAEKGIEVKTQAWPLDKVHEMMAAYGSPQHSGKMVVRIRDD